MFVRPNSILRLGAENWDPIKEFERFSNEVNHFFNDANWNSGVLSLSSRSGISFSKTDAGATMKMELPGMDPKSLEISVQGSELSLKSKRTEKEESSPRRYLKRERLLAPLDRRFKLGFTVDAEKVVASYTNGILEVELPKIESEQPKTIPITVH